MTTSAAATAGMAATPVVPKRRAPPGDIPIQDWRGQPVDCAACPHGAMRAHADGCEPGRSCVQDAYARRIDRFFRDHRELAARHLAHPYFEVRAIAARYADVFALEPLMADPDETVRLQVALRVPPKRLVRLVHDPHREVRIRVAMRVGADLLALLRGDPDYEVRAQVARRLPEGLLPTMVGDRDPQVRREVARRVPMPTLLRLADDAAPEVRRVVVERLPAGLLPKLVDDDDVIVAHVARERLAAHRQAQRDAERDDG